MLHSRTVCVVLRKVANGARVTPLFSMLQNRDHKMEPWRSKKNTEGDARKFAIVASLQRLTETAARKFAIAAPLPRLT